MDHKKDLDPREKVVLEVKEWLRFAN